MAASQSIYAVYVETQGADPVLPWWRASPVTRGPALIHHHPPPDDQQQAAKL
jgi:hypothetical protein